MSSSSTKICFNPECKDGKPERFRNGWRLRTGEHAELCDACGLAYEEGRFCETFHSEASGWRSCESCGKRVHCGCIVSIHTFMLLDAGGVECMACARKNFIMAQNPTWPSSLFVPLPLPDRLKDLSVKNWSQMAGPGIVAGPWRQSPNLWNTVQPELHQRIPYEVDRSNGNDKLIYSEHPASVSENKNIEVPSERVMSGSLKLAATDMVANGNAGIDIVPALNKFHTEEKNLDGLQRSCRLTGKNDPMDSRKGVIVEPGMKNPITGVNYDTHQSSRVNISVQSSTSKDDLSTPHFGLAVPCALPNETHGQTRISVTPSQRLTSPRPLVKQFHANAHNGLDTSGEAQVRNGRSRGDARGRNQLLPRYWPKITDQELQQISGDSNSVITPLFEKMLSASDAGRIGRLVLPKKCAEAYFPTISHPEGLPLKVQDAKGKEWVFQFRFWPNNNSRMYVLEGVTPCIQSMQLQAGDTVTFSRIDPDGKLVMGFRKASTVPTTEQESKAHKTANSVSTNREVNRKNKSIEGVSTPHRSLKGESTNYSLLSQVNSADPVRTWSEIDKSGYIAKEVPKAKSSLPGKRKNSSLGLKNKRLQIRKEDLIELKLTWEEAQGLLRPPPDQVPTVMVIEGYEFEEYEEAPILGRPTIFTSNHMGKEIQWVQCEDCSRWRKLPAADVLLPPRWTCANNLWDPKRSSCSSAQEITSEQLEGLISSNNSGAAQKTKASKQEADAVEVSDGLDTLANLAILGEGEAIPQSDQPTTKHPRHRPGCTCIVCIQPPSGKGPKHKQTCTCNVCLTVKRRFQTLMLRREKRQSEKEAETARKKQQLQFPAKLEQEDEPPMSSNANNSSPNHKSVGEGVDEDHLRTKSSSSPFKGQIDLNIQPEREDELSSPVSDSGSVIRLPPDASEKHLRQPCSADDDDSPSNQIEQGGEEKLHGDDMDVEVEHLVTSSNMPVPNS